MNYNLRSDLPNLEGDYCVILSFSFLDTGDSNFMFSLFHLYEGGAASCVSIHVGEIRPGGLRGNHRHHTCNETFVIWGAKTRFRVSLIIHLIDRLLNTSDRKEYLFLLIEVSNASLNCKGITLGREGRKESSEFF